MIQLEKVCARIGLTSLTNNWLDTIDWYQLSLISSDLLTELNDALSPFTSAGYALLPKAAKNQTRSKISLSILRPPRQLLSKVNSNAWQEIEFPADIGGLKAHAAANILTFHSSPFALVNPALFLDYLSTGNISYVSTNKNKALFLLSDLRYLDGMDGGPVFLSTSNQCVGLIAGSLKKNSGEGDLSVIVPWNIVLQHLLKRVLSVPASKPPFKDFVFPWLMFNGVVMIEVYYSNLRKGWGSGILLDDTTIVSNLHLIGSDCQRATAWISETEYIELDILGNPLNGLDIVFFRLKKSISKPRPVTLYQGSYNVGQAVRSLGYGLIYPHRTGDLPFQPLSSNGIVSRAISMDLCQQMDPSTMSVDVDSPSTNNNIPVLLVSSAGCWNGSSGGALFDTKTGHVISMMTSNGRVNDTGEVIPQMAFSLPSNIVQYAWDLLRRGETKTVSSRVTALWQLEETHSNAMVELPLNSKL